MVELVLPADSLNSTISEDKEEDKDNIPTLITYKLNSEKYEWISLNPPFKAL